MTCRSGVVLAIFLAEALGAADTADDFYRIIDPSPREDPFSIHLDAMTGVHPSDERDSAFVGGGNLPTLGAEWGDVLVAFGTQAVAIADPQQQRTSPTHLSAADITAVGRILPGDGWMLALQWTERRSSDGTLTRPEGTDREVDAFVRCDLGDHHALIVLATLATQHRWVDAAIVPGLAWLFAPDDQHWLLVGAPAAYAYWRPAPIWSIECGILHDPHAALTLYPALPWTAALEWDWSQNSFRSKAGSSVLQEMQLALTTSYAPTAWLEIRGLVGIAFDRTLTVGADRHGRGGDPRGLEAGPVIGIGTSAGF